MNYRVTIVGPDGQPVTPGSAAWETLRQRTSALWAEAAAYRRDHPEPEPQEGGEPLKRSA